MKTVAIFADIQNIYYTTRDIFSRKFNYQHLWELVTKEGKIVTAYAYAISRNQEKQKGFQKAIQDIGFTVKLKPYLQRHDGTSKGDWDVGITIDILESARNVEKIILLSGDGDFAMLADYVIEKFSVEFDVYAVRALTSDFLINSVTNFKPIDEDFLLPTKISTGS